MSVGSLYDASGDLDAVVNAVIGKSAEMISMALHMAVEKTAKDNRSRVVALGEAYFDFTVAEPQRWSLMFDCKSNLPLDEVDQDFQKNLLKMPILTGGGDLDSDMHRQFFLLLWASVHGVVSLACRPTIVAINPEAARTYIGDLVVSGFSAFPVDREGLSQDINLIGIQTWQ